MENLERDIKKILKQAARVDIDSMTRKELEKLHKILNFADSAITFMEDFDKRKKAGSAVNKRRSRRKIKKYNSNMKKFLPRHKMNERYASKIWVKFTNNKARAGLQKGEE